MNIAIDISQIVYKGGVVTYIDNLVRALLDIDKENSYVLFGSSWGRYAELIQFFSKISNANVVKRSYRLPLSLLELLGNRLRLLPIEPLVGRIDIFHSSDWIQFPSRSRKVTTIHDLAVYAISKDTPKEIFNVHKRRLAWVKKECDAVIADSYSTKDDIVHYLHIPGNKIHVVYLGVDTQFTPQSDERVDKVKKKYAIAGDYILMFGAPGYRKNVKGAVAAFEKLQAEIPHDLVIVGKTDEIAIKNGERIIMRDTLPFSDLLALYSGASCFMYPSLYEGFGLPILEAMACGTIVITSRRGSLTEIMHPSNFVIEDPTDENEIKKQMLKVIGLSAMERKKRIARGIQHAQTFTWKKCAQETLAVYKKVRSI